jgi:mono/diheme cytochrome c family protein
MNFSPVLLFALALAICLSACRKEETAGGEKLYAAHCAACHQANGQGLAGAFPPLTGSSYLAEGAGPAISIVLNGLSGPITVNGANYNAVMPGLSYLNDEEVAKIITFVMNSWGNPGGEVSAAEVAAVRGNQ